MKYHIWKLGVVFTDNVSIAPGKTRFCAAGSGMSLEARSHKLGQVPRRFSAQLSKTEGLPGVGGPVAVEGGWAFTWQFLG